MRNATHYAPKAHQSKELHAPFVEGGEPFLREHLGGAIEDSSVRSGRRVHISGLDDVNRGRHHRRHEAGAERRHHVTRHGVAQQTQRQQTLLDDVIRYEFARVDDGGAGDIRARSWKSAMKLFERVRLERKEELVTLSTHATPKRTSSLSADGSNCFAKQRKQQ